MYPFFSTEGTTLSVTVGSYTPLRSSRLIHLTTAKLLVHLAQNLVVESVPHGAFDVTNRHECIELVLIQKC